MLEAAVDEIAEVVRDLRRRRIGKGVDHHKGPGDGTAEE